MSKPPRVSPEILGVGMPTAAFIRTSIHIKDNVV